jgi:hypothetical protein
MYAIRARRGDGAGLDLGAVARRGEGKPLGIAARWPYV